MKIHATKNLSPVIQPNETPTHVTQKTFKDTIQNILGSIEKDFAVTQRTTANLVNALPEEHKSIFRAQVHVSELQFKVEMMTRVADGLQQSIKKVQQQN